MRHVPPRRSGGRGAGGWPPGWRGSWPRPPPRPGQGRPHGEQRPGPRRNPRDMRSRRSASSARASSSRAAACMTMIPAIDAQGGGDAHRQRRDVAAGCPRRRGRAAAGGGQRLAAVAGHGGGDGSLGDRKAARRPPGPVLRPDRRGRGAQRLPRRARLERAAAPGGRGGRHRGRRAGDRRLGRRVRDPGLATFAAMAVAVALGGARVMVAQAAAGAILTVAVADGRAGPQRLADALVGAGVALVFTQVLFSPEPVALLRRAEATALTDLAGALERTARALERDDDELAERAMNSLRDLRDRLAELSRARRASSRVVRHSLVWRTRMAQVVRESENAGHLDLLGGSCLLLTRTALAMSPPERRRLAPGVRQLAGAIADLARAPGDRPTRQRAADRALDPARRAASSPGQYHRRSPRPPPSR